MNIITERLVITNLTMDMCEDIQKNSQDDDVRSFVPDEVFDTVDEAKDVVSWLIGAGQTLEGPYLYPVLLKDNTNIGYVQACQIDEGWEVGYHIAKDYTGKGYATEALQAFIPYILDKIGIREIYGEVVEENTASHRVLEKSGFVLKFQGIGQYQGVDRAIRKYLFTK